jgi:hypothetical protein
MEEIYILPDGSNIDISDYSESERLSFLVKNPKAKKQKGAAKSATAAPARTIAQKKPMESTSAVGSLDSKKFRLATEADLQGQQKKGLMPPPSTQRRVPTEDYNYLYDLAKNKPEYSAVETQKIKLPGQRTSVKLKGKIGGSKQEIDNFVENFRDNPVIGEIGLDNQFKIQKAKEKIQLTDSELTHPYMYYSSVNQEKPDDFVKKNYNDKELEDLGINIQDFDGFLNKKGYKADYLDKESKGLFEGEGRGFSGYNIELAKELAKKKLLDMYMEDMQQKDFTRQDLNQDIEIASGFRKEKQIVKNQLFDQNGMTKYIEKNFPIITQTLKDRDKENAKIYQESKQGGTDFFSWETPSKIGKAGWNAITDRIAQVSSTAYDIIGLDTAAEGIRMLDEENKLVKPLDRGVSYVSGKTVEYDGTKYIVDSKGEIYDTDAKIRVTDLFDDNMHKKLIEDSKYGSSDWIFSTQGAAVQTSSVMADMLLQAAVTRGVGSFGAIASTSRTALIGTGRTGKSMQLLNDTSQLLRKVPLDRGVGYSMIGQGALGYSQGYEETLKAARDNGINDAQAFKLANAAAQRMAVLYSTTGVINPQVNAVENIFGSKNIIKKAIDQYMKVGEKGFVGYIDDIIKSTPRNLVEFAEEGGKEVIQENIQQVGEIGVNRMTNRDAGKKIMNDVMTGDDFMNTSILSFISSGMMSKMKMPSFYAGDQSIDDLRSLNTLAKNKKEFTKSIDNLVAKKVFTKEQSDNLKADVDIYSNNINKLMKSTPPDAAMPIMRELDKVTKLTDEKQTVDKAFHGQIDEKIEAIRANMNKIFYESELKVKNEAIEKAIKKGVAKGISMKSFSTTEEVQSYLVNEVGMSEETAKVYASQPGFALNSETLKRYSKDPKSISDKSQVIVVNESKTRDAGVIQHEFLHGVLQNTLKDSPEAQKLVGKALATEIRRMNDELILKGSNERTMPDWFIQRMKQYTDRDTKSRADAILEYKMELVDAKGDPSRIAAIEARHQDKLAALEGVVWEEALTIYSDALRRGYVTYNESTFTKLGDVIRRVLQRLGIKDIKFNSGKDVYNFIKDYNNSVETGNWGKALTKMSNKGAEINIKPEGAKKVEPVKPKPAFSTTEKFSLGEKKSSENIKKDVNKHYNKEKWSTGSVRGRDENPAIERVLFDILGEYDYIIRGKAKTLGFANVPGYNDLDMISETYVQLIPHIRNFNKEFFQKREEYKKELEAKGLDPNSKEFKDKVETQDEKGYKGKNGVVKENDDLNAWINSQLVNKMNGAMKSGNVSEQVFSEDVEGEMFKESKISDGFGGDDSYLRDEGDSTFETNDEFEAQQEKLAVLLRDPVFRFVDEKGVPVQIETIPFGGLYISSASDKEVPANIKLRTETDPVKIAELKKELKDLERGLELKEKKDLTFEEKEELKKLQSFKSFDLSSGDVVNTFKALSTLDTPARIVVEDVAEEILRSPNIQTLEYRNFKEKLADRSKTMMKRITFEHGPGLESLMYNEWKLIYDVINHPMDPVTGQSSYASKKLPPTLKEFDDKGRLKKIGDITRVKFLQAYYKVDEVEKIIKKYGGKDAAKELKQLEPEEVNKVTGQPLAQNTHFDRRTALRELFGDVMVLQEARRLIRDPQFLERVAERQVNLYNDLKDDVIRAEVLKDLSRGKSDIVKFSLVETNQDIRPSLPINRGLLRTQKALSEGIANNVYYGPDSLPVFKDIIKFSLSDILDQSTEEDGVKRYTGFNKKFEVHYKDIYNFNKEEEGNIDEIESGRNYYIKALQYSDTVDTKPGSVKLHTLKSYEEIETEVISRIKNLFDLITIAPNVIVRTENAEKINPYIIQEYKEDYIDAMLQKAVEDNDQAYIDHFTALKNNESYRKKDIINKQLLQHEALMALTESLYDNGDINYEEGEDGERYMVSIKNAWHNGFYFEGLDMGLSDFNLNSAVKVKEPNGLKFNPFFTYLFLNDVLSNRYTSNAIEQTVERKPFKISQYRTTFTPIDSYIDENLIKQVQNNYSHIELKNPAFVYSFLNLNKSLNYVNEWENKRKVFEDNGNKTFKFKQSDKRSNILSLNSFASRNVNPKGLWCTGQRSLSFATSHLTNGDFFIVSNNEHIPIIAVRLVTKSTSGVGEVVGVGINQSFKKEQMPLISNVFKLSDLKDKQDYIKYIDLSYSLLTSNDISVFLNNTKEQNGPLIKGLSDFYKGGFFRFELEKESKEELINKIKTTKNSLRDIGLLDNVKTLEDLAGPDLTILINREEELELLQEQEIITIDIFGYTSEDTDGDIPIIDFADGKPGSYDLPNLEEIDILEFRNAFGISAPNLSKGYSLTVSGETSEGLIFVELPKSIDYNLNINVNVIPTEESNIFDFSLEPIDFNGQDFSLDTNFETQEDSEIYIYNAINTDGIYLYGLAGAIILPEQVNTLRIDMGSESQLRPKKVLFQSVKNINLLQLRFDDSFLPPEERTIKYNVNLYDISEQAVIQDLEITSSEKLTPELTSIILNSSLGLVSNEIRVRSFQEDKNGRLVNVETIVKSNKNESDVIKFSLAEEENGKLSPFLKGLPFTKQWLVARDIDRAINKAKMSSSAQQTEIDKLNAKISKTADPVKIKELKEKISELERFDKVTFKVPSKSELSDEAIAYFIISKVAEGYNDFEFRVKKNASGPLTKQVLDNLDFKSKKAAEIRKLNSNLEEGMNQIIEENTGVEASETFSPETAKNLGKNIGKYDIFLPPEDEDFLGLLYTLASGKGKKGEEQMDFLKRALIQPYTDAMLKLMQARQVMYKDWRELINKKHKGITKVLKTDSGYGGYLNDQAIRVYLWRRAGYDIPGLDKKDVFNLQEIVRKNPKLRKFAEDVSLLSKQANGYMEPDSNWGFGSVVGDINNIISKSNRQKYLEQWSSNVEKVFSKDNLSKIEAVYGRKYVIALKNTLDRMKTGTNRAEGSSDAFLNWLNGSTAVTMFLNVRSAVLQTIGAVNYINTSDNNIAKAGLALLNVPQYTKDFFTLWNSDYLKDRRSGLTTDVVEAELAQAMNDPRNKSMIDKFNAVNYLILKFGFNPTRYADSFAIAFGGAGFYRNRLNTYKKQGMTEEDAVNKTLRDFYDVSEVSQQSADVSKISMNQASTKGRILLSFMNTPFQYSRLIKKSAIDIIKGRGSIENNLAKIVYYGAVQNILFNALQNALFAMFLDDEEDQKSGKFDTAKIRTINGALDTFVRGMGMKGVLLSIFKNALMKAYEKRKDPKGYGDVLAEIANLSPSVGIKVRAIVKSYKAVTYNLSEIKYKGFSIDNTHAIEAATSLTSALTNLPADRLYMKIQNIGNALSDEFNTWQRIAFLFGYNEWNLNPTEKRQVNSNASGGLKIPVLKTSELKQPGLKTP